MSDISKSYPYYSIAKKHGVDYSIVLAVADAVTHNRHPNKPVEHLIPVAVMDDILDAAAHYRAVQRGLVPFPTT